MTESYGIVVDQLATSLFSNLSFELPSRGNMGLIGQNGVGKSSLYALINGDIDSKQGTISCGRVIYIPTLDVFDSYVTDTDYVNLLSTEEKARFNSFGEQEHVNRKIKTYSVGMKALFACCLSLALAGQVLILDELMDDMDK